jgi:dihydrofolate reductase
MPTVSIIVAMDKNALIGCTTGLPWRVPADLKRFRALTWSKPIIMGRRTHEQIGRVLPGRTNIVLTREPNYQATGCVVVHSVEAAMAAAQICLERDGGDEIMVIGGAHIYADFLPQCRRVYLTIVNGEFEGNTWFPGGVPGSPEWKGDRVESYPVDDANPHAHHFQILERGISQSTSRQSPLKPLHADDSLIESKLDKYGKQSNQELIDSLRPGQPGSLKVRPDGTIVDGHHRIKILRDRGVDVDSLPREVIPKDDSALSP